MERQITSFEALQKAVDTAGSQSALARICGLSPTAVWKWLQSAKRVPAEYVLRVEAATSVSRHDLRPDIYPREAGVASPLDDCGPILSPAALRGQSNSHPVLHSRPNDLNRAAGRAA